MCRKRKRFVGMIMAVTMFLGMSVMVSAEEQPPVMSEEEKAFLSEALYGVEVQKEMLGLADVDFSELCLGEAFQTYVYRDEEFEPGLRIYPVLDHGKLILWAIETDETVQITQALVEEVSRAVENDQDFTIVYDRNSAYLYTDNQFTLLAVSAVEDTTRSVLNVESLNVSGLETASFSRHTVWVYEPAAARTPVYYGCDVKFVSQNPPSYI